MKAVHELYVNNIKYTTWLVKIVGQGRKMDHVSVSKFYDEISTINQQNINSKAFLSHQKTNITLSLITTYAEMREYAHKVSEAMVNYVSQRHRYFSLIYCTVHKPSTYLQMIADLSPCGRHTSDSFSNAVCAKSLLVTKTGIIYV